MSDFPKYDDNPYFNEELDQTYELVVIAEEEFKPSFILHSLKPQTYSSALQDRAQQIYEMVYNQYPTPIAISCYRFFYGSESARQKLTFLKHTWEATINLIYALTIADYRSAQQKFVDTNVTLKDLVSDNIEARLNLTSTLLQYASDKDLDLILPALFPSDTIEKMKIVYSAILQVPDILSETKAEVFLSGYEDRVLSVLQDLRFLSEIDLIRYLGHKDTPDKIQFEIFQGHSTNRKVKETQLQPTQLAKVTPFLNSKHVLATKSTWSWVLDLTPFVQCNISSFDPKLSYLKGIEKDKCSFVVVGDFIPYDAEIDDYKMVLDELEYLCKQTAGSVYLSDTGGDLSATTSMNKENLRNLRKVLARLYPQEKDSRIVADDAGLSLANINFDSRADTNWYHILDEAIKGNRLNILLEVVYDEYSSNEEFVSIYHQLLPC